MDSDLWLCHDGPATSLYMAHTNVSEHEPDWVFLRQEKDFTNQTDYQVFDVYYCSKCLQKYKEPGVEPI